MRWFSIFGGVRAEPPQPAPDDSKAAPSGAPYSPQYEVIVGQGHDHPTPFFSAPALVWHVGVWPQREHDPHANVSMQGAGSTAAKDEPARIGDSDEEFRRRRRLWVEQIDRQLKAMQSKRWPTVPRNPIKQFIAEKGGSVPDAGSIVFTMWWRSPAAPEGEDQGAIRVKVHCNLTPDYVTYSFYMDVGTPWGARESGPDGRTNPRRTAIIEAVGNIERICALGNAAQGASQRRYAQVAGDHLTEQEDAAILAARNLLYVDVWEAFIAEVACSLEDLAGNLGEVFANFRGVVLGVPPTQAVEPVDQRFPRFSEDPRFNVDGSEANAVVDAYWPVVRRIVPHADFREFVVCGLLGWRALYLTALGSPAQYDADEERPASLGDKSEGDIRVDLGNGLGNRLGDARNDSCVRPRYAGGGRNHPVRYLMLTKAQLNPRQLGRIVERINALGTLRLYALKDWPTIVQADTKIRSLGQELDLVTKDWSDKRRLLDGLNSFEKIIKARSDPDYGSIRKYLVHVQMPGRLRRLIATIRGAFWRLAGETGEFVRREEANKLLDAKFGVLSEISSELEGKLISIGAEIDRLSLEATGGLHFRISRSEIHVAEFNQLLGLLQVGNIQTWTSYEQFVKRGLSPTFKYVQEVGRRIVALRTRLTSVLATIETSALVGQSSATRYNTAQLRRIAFYGMLLIVFYLARQTYAAVLELWANNPGYFRWLRQLLGW